MKLLSEVYDEVNNPKSSLDSLIESIQEIMNNLDPEHADYLIEELHTTAKEFAVRYGVEDEDYEEDPYSKYKVEM